MIDEMAVSQLEIEYARLKEKYADLLIQNDYMEQYYAAMVYGSVFAYEIDVTKDKILTLPEKLQEMYHVHVNSSYDAFLKTASKATITETDQELVYTYASREAILKAYALGERQISVEFLARDAADEIKWFRNRLYLLQHPVSGDIHAIVTTKNIQQQKINELRLQERARLDPLTHLANRNFLEEQFTLELQSEHKNHCALLLDIDDFKNINDTYGHQTGDSVLIAFAKMLQGKFRHDDIVARLGGDEFFVFMKNADPQIIHSRAQMIIEACKTLMPAESGITITPSIGISIYPDHGKTFKELYKNADIALYTSKLNGKNSYTVFSPELMKRDEDEKK